MALTPVEAQSAPKAEIHGMLRYGKGVSIQSARCRVLTSAPLSKAIQKAAR